MVIAWTLKEDLYVHVISATRVTNVNMVCTICRLYVYSVLMFKVAFSLFSNINQSACSTPGWVLNSQSDFDRVMYTLHWEFLIHEKVISMLICLILSMISHVAESFSLLKNRLRPLYYETGRLLGPQPQSWLATDLCLRGQSFSKLALSIIDVCQHAP